MRRGLSGIMFLFTLPGILLHELSHALAVNVAGGNVTKFNWNSVEHEGEYTIFGALLIGYAPLVINSAVAYWLVKFWVFPLSMAAKVGVMYVTFSIALSALPSYSDAVNPWKLFWKISKKAPIYSLFVLPFLLLTIPGLILSYLGYRSSVFMWATSIAYMGVILSVSLWATGAIEGFSQIEYIINSFI